jgi:hypothetical protein
MSDKLIKINGKQLPTKAKDLQKSFQDSCQDFMTQIKALKKGEISEIKVADSLHEKLLNNLEAVDGRFADMFRERECVILSDWSTSMEGKKEAELKRALKIVVPKHPNIDLIRFDSIVEPFEITNIDGMNACGATAMGEALKGAWANRYQKIILITDGQPTDMKQKDILNKAKINYFVPIHIIGIGTPSGTELGGDLDEIFLRRLAMITKGSYTRLLDEEEELVKLPGTIEKVLLLK